MDVDVVIAGAGPTGLMLAGELALAGVRVRVLERREHRQRDSRALTLHARSVEVMDLRGMAERFLERGRPMPGWHFAGLETRLDFSALDSRHGYTLFLAQADTEELLAERARALGAEVVRGHEIIALHQDADGVDVTVNSQGADYTLRAAFVAGCDGARSIVREQAGIDFPGTDTTMTAMLGDFAEVDQKAIDEADDHNVMIIPLGEGVTRFVVTDPARMRVPTTEPVTAEEFLASLDRVVGTTFGAAKPRWLSRFGNATRIAERYRSGRVLLAGDAAHVHFPAGGQGLNIGLQDAMNLGWKLAAEINGWAPPGLLDTYESERRPVGQLLTENTQVQTLLLELTLLPAYQRPAAALRCMLNDLLGIEEVNHRLASQVSALGTTYPAKGDAPLIGARVPDVALTADGSPATRVYELMHDGQFALLDLTGAGVPDDAALTGWRDRVRTVAVTIHDPHPGLDGLTEVLVRPDGHVAWATREQGAQDRAALRKQALETWAGTAATVAS